MRQIVVDTETTGLLIEENHRIIEIACIELINRKMTGNKLHYYINPGREIDFDAKIIHGITNEFLSDKPTFPTIIEALIDFIRDAELIIHNAPFDIGFINYELSLANKKWQIIENYCRITDSLVLAKQLHVGQRNSLDALCKRYGIDNSEREVHGALLDAQLLAQVYLAMTGGQGSLFDDGIFQENIPSHSVVKHELTKRDIPLKIIAANAEEIEKHLEYLTNLSQNGNCVWLNDFSS